MYFTTNIKLLRKRKNRTQEEVSVFLGMKRSTFSGYENGIAEPGIDILLAFSKYYGISIDTLIKVDLTKLGEFQLRELERGNDVYVSGSKLRIITSTVNKKSEENIELVSEKARAGYAQGFADPEYINELPVFHLPFLSKQKKYRSFQICGHSMLPIPDKSIVTGEFVQDWHEIKTGKAYIIVTLDDGVVFKMAENRQEEESLLYLHSLNKLYAPYPVFFNQIKEVWKFVHYISNEIPENETEEDIKQSIKKLQKDVYLLKEKILKEEA